MYYLFVKPPPSVQSVVWRYNEFGDKLRDIENQKLCTHKLDFIVLAHWNYSQQVDMLLHYDALVSRANQSLLFTS
jgi:hypothetical protein